MAFAFLGNTLFLTILVSMLSNTFRDISSNATAEIQFRRAVLTLEGVKADAVFAYQPPFNILAVFLFLPLKFIVSPRWFHKIHVATVRALNLPLLLIIAVAERRLLWPSQRMQVGDTFRPIGKKRFWQKWHLSASWGLRAVFEVAPPDDVHEDIAVDDALTHHLIRKQFTRTNTSDSLKRPARRDSMFPGVRARVKGSFTEDAEDSAALAVRIEEMEKTMRQMRDMLGMLLKKGQMDEEEEEEDMMGESSTLGGGGFTTESSFRGSTQ